MHKAFSSGAFLALMKTRLVLVVVRLTASLPRAAGKPETFDGSSSSVRARFAGPRPDKDTAA